MNTITWREATTEDGAGEWALVGEVNGEECFWIQKSVLDNQFYLVVEHPRLMNLTAPNAGLHAASVEAAQQMAAQLLGQAIAVSSR